MNNKLLLSSALGLATLAVAIDHTRHRLPEPQQTHTQQGTIIIEDDTNGDGSTENPCGMGETPCGL